MKSTWRFAFACIALFSLGFACTSLAKPAKVASALDGSVATPRFGVSFVNAGVTSGFISDAGLLTFSTSAPINVPLGASPITAVEIRSISLDIVNGIASVQMGTVGGIPQNVYQMTIPLSAANEIAFTNAIKAQIQAQYGVVLQ